MTRHMLGNLFLAFVFAVVAAVKVARLVAGELDDALSNVTGLS